MPGMDMSFLTKLLQADSAGIAGLASKAAMKAPPPQIPNPGAAGTLAPGAFAGSMNPSVGAVPQGFQAASGMQMGAVPMMAGGGMGAGANPAMAGMMGGGMDAMQINALAGATQKPPMQYPGAAAAANLGNIQMGQIGIPQAGTPAAMSLAQLLGR
jgi:hypothetical protein